MEEKTGHLFVNSPNALAGNYAEKLDTSSLVSYGMALVADTGFAFSIPRSVTVTVTSAFSKLLGTVHGTLTFIELPDSIMLSELSS
jgi:hypothetical protein